jgi:L-aminopeptidase/D-esterase-like protein
MVRPGPRNTICDVEGIRVGNAVDAAARTGVTVILPETPAVAAVDTRGGAPGTRETDLLAPSNLVDRIDAIVLSGGSAYGLDAAGGVMEWLAARQRGFRVGTAVVPIVPAAILFDLLNGGDKAWREPPYRRLGSEACGAADTDFVLGNVGAGLGAKAGRLKGGLGSASLVSSDGLQAGAVIAANPSGSVVMPGTAAFWAWPFERDGELGGRRPTAALDDLDVDTASPLAVNTTIGVAATNVALDKAAAQRLAIMAHDGLARAIRPVHTPFDGDVLFVISTGHDRRTVSPQVLARLGSMLADCVARATARGVYLADSLGAFASYRATYPAGAG